MSVQQFCLRWNNHQPNFISVCSSLLHNGTLVDVTLAAEGRQLQAHKIVLSACSSYFQTLFTTNPCQHPIVILKDVQYDDLKTMVDFMYYGEVNVSQEQLPHILKTAEMLKIKGLAEMPTDAATLTKSESKSSSDQPDQLQSSGTDSLWGSTESQFQQQQQPQSHHHSHHHHQQSQTQQMHQLRRTPSPLGTGTSPATRRKRLRKSSNNGSGDRITDDHSGVDAGGNINLSQMGQMSFGGNTSGLGHTLHTKIIKESASVDVDSHQQDSSPDSLDDGNGHSHTMQIKPETDLSVPQTLPLDISGGTTPSENDGPNASCSQSSHSGTPPTSSTANVMGSKRNRFLIRQPRIKRDSDANNQISPETSALETFDPFSGTVTSSSPSLLLTVPPRIERHASEPAPSLVPSSPHLLSVPQGTPFLVKQHSHPLLPSQQSHHMGVSSSTSSTSSFAIGLHRQHSHPLSSTLSGHISVSDAIYPHVTTSSGYIITGSPVPPSSTVPSGHLITHQQPIVSLSSSSTPLKQEAENSSHLKSGQQQHITATHASSSSVILISEPPSPVPSVSVTATPNLGSSSFEHMPTLRVKNEELQRSVSSPQTNREILTLENPRSSHCPVIRPGPALGCNFCWNTIDGHGRILRRKTKYHCPECQTNLCIVPCFQEYHERLSTENTASSANDNNKNYSSSTSAGGGGGGTSGSNQRHYSKTESI